MQEMWCGIHRDARWEGDDSVLRATDGTQEMIVDPALVIEGGDGCMAQLGKRYRCEVCATEVLCTKAGEGKPLCCDKEMQLQEPKPLPSSD